MKKPLSLKI